MYISAQENTNNVLNLLLDNINMRMSPVNDNMSTLNVIIDYREYRLLHKFFMVAWIIQ